MKKKKVKKWKGKDPKMMVWSLCDHEYRYLFYYLNMNILDQIPDGIILL